MKSCLGFPNTVEFILIVLTVEDLSFQFVVRISVQLRHQVLTDCLFVDKQLLPPVADVPEVST